MKRNIFYLLLMIFCCQIPVFAQNISRDTLEEYRILASTNPEYPATPGDIYTLSYFHNNRINTQYLSIESNYSINLSMFEQTLDSRGMTFPDVKNRIESIVSRAYRGSVPQLKISSVGVFQVYIHGEVKRPGYYSTWGLARLTDLVNPLFLEKSSNRNIQVISSDNMTKTYDLFQAQWKGKKDQNPRMQPGMSVYVQKSTKSVLIAGEVYRPGHYSLKSSDGLREILSYYADGLLSTADDSSIQVISITDEGEQSQFYSLSEIQRTNPPVADGSAIKVSSKADSLLSVYLEGAINTSGKHNNSMRVNYQEGLSVYTLVLDSKERISPFADITRIHINRIGQSNSIQVNISAIEQQTQKDVLLRPGDRIVIPLSSYEVFLTGEVQRSSWITVTSITRLSEVVEKNITENASIRDVQVKNSSGQTQTYDLFNFYRNGDATENPYLKPGDTITVEKVHKTVTVQGSVYNPATYQLLEDETLHDLIDIYAGGFLPTADQKKIDIIYITNDGQKTKTYTYEEISSTETELPPKSTVHIRDLSEKIASVYVEGAIGATRSEAGSYRVDYISGQSVYRLILGAKDIISPLADLTRIRINRQNQTETILVNISKIEDNPDLDIHLEKEDRIFIPYGSYKVLLTGEIENTVWMTVEPGTRLSEVVNRLLTEYSSIRDIEISNGDDATKSYDLFEFYRNGNNDQNPFLKPGDVISIQRARRIIEIAGEVEKPGRYQLLEGETLEELLFYYAGKPTIYGDLSNISIKRWSEAIEENHAIKYINYSSQNEIPLFNEDQIIVPSLLQQLPVVYLEGAIGREGQGGANLSISNRVKHKFRTGEKLSQVLVQYQHLFGESTYLQKGQIRQVNGTIINLNMEDLLENYNPVKDYILQPGDYIIIPFRQYFVTVSGAALRPGRFPYIPNRTADYYIALAGGFNPAIHMGDRFNITDINGKKKDRDSFLEPEDTIHVPTNNPLYFIGQIATVSTLIVEIISLILTIAGNLKE